MYGVLVSLYQEESKFSKCNVTSLTMSLKTLLTLLLSKRCLPCVWNGLSVSAPMVEPSGTGEGTLYFSKAFLANGSQTAAAETSQAKASVFPVDEDLDLHRDRVTYSTLL